MVFPGPRTGGQATSPGVWDDHLDASCEFRQNKNGLTLDSVSRGDCSSLFVFSALALLVVGSMLGEQLDECVDLVTGVVSDDAEEQRDENNQNGDSSRRAYHFYVFRRGY